jgi:hypothetical protein
MLEGEVAWPGAISLADISITDIIAVKTSFVNRENKKSFTGHQE